LRANLRKRKAQSRARDGAAGPADGEMGEDHSKDEPNPQGAAIAPDRPKP
jgi:hypothetical protein